MEWSYSNKTTLEQVKDNQFLFATGSIIYNILLELKLITITVKTMGMGEKIKIFIPGAKIIELLSNVKKPTPVFILPRQIPMIVKPKLSESEWNIKEGKYSQLGG